MIPLIRDLCRVRTSVRILIVSRIDLKATNAKIYNGFQCFDYVDRDVAM
jgi:hypothetical protein